MRKEICMKRTAALTSVVVLLLAVCVWTLDAWGRAGGGKSTGSRGSRTWSAPDSHPSSSSNRQAVPPAAGQQPMPQRSGWMRGLMGGIMGFALGGLIGSLLFGGFGGGLFGGIGMLEILLIGGLLYFAFAYMRRRQQPAPASPYGYAPPQEVETPSWQSASRDTRRQRQRATWSAVSGTSGRWIVPLIRCVSLIPPPRSFSTSSRRGWRVTCSQYAIS